MPFQNPLAGPKGCSHQCLETCQGVVVREDGRDSVSIRLGFHRLSLDELEEGRGPEPVPFLSQPQLLIGPNLVFLLDESCLVSGLEGREPTGEIGLQAEFLGP